MKKNNTGFIIALVILTLLLISSFGYIAYDKVMIKETSKEKTEKEQESTKEKELDVNSRLVQNLYNKVTSDDDESCYAFWRYTDGDRTKGLNDFESETAEESIKMNLVAKNIKESEKKFLSCDDKIPDKDPENSSMSVCYFNKYAGTNEFQYGYTRQYIERIYKELYGANKNLNKTIEIPLNMHSTEKLVYIESLDMYAIYRFEGGGTCAGGYDKKLTKALQKENQIELYQTVTEIDEEGKKVSDSTLVYTFSLENDGMYVFTSRKKI